jgi:hypothetical protein
MKFKLYTILSILLGYSATCPLDDYTNQTYMFVRPIFDTISIAQASWHNVVYKKQKNGAAAQVMAIYGQTFENLNNSSYFLFDYKNKLNISAGTTGAAGTGSVFAITGPGAFKAVSNPTQGQLNVATLDRDILGQWLGINQGKDFSFALHPAQRQACALIELSQDLKNMMEWSIFENWSINLAAPITWIENNIHAQGDQVALDAFHQPGYKYANFINGDRTSIRLTQAMVSLNTKYMSENDIQVNTSTGVIIPLVEQPCNGSIFEPVQGFNSHFGFDTQVHFQFPIVKKTPDSPSRILMFIDIHNNFLARNHQLRTFDIKHKPFSRYMKLYDNKNNDLVPAMNVLTLRSRVEPYNIVNFMTGFRFAQNDNFGEIGYELWAHGSERVTPEAQPGHRYEYFENHRYGIAFINTDGVLATIDQTTGDVIALPVGQQGLTASDSTINYVAAPDGQVGVLPTPSFQSVNKYLTIKDLNHDAAGFRSTITHRAFLSAGFGNHGKVRDYFANFGAFIEASQNNTALCFWGGWIKGGFSF